MCIRDSYPDGWGEAAPLTGLLYCADCGGKMYVHRTNNGLSLIHISAMVSNTILDFPDPDTPVNTVIFSFGIRKDTCFKLF